MNTNRMIQLSANAVALTLFAAAIGCGRGQNPQAQLALLAGALPISLVGSYHGALADKTEPYARMRDAAALEMYAGQLARAIEIPVMPAPMSMPAPMLPASAPMGEGMSEAIATTPLESVLSTGTGIALLGNSGSGKSSIVQWLIGEAQPESLVILDPHNDGKTWGDLPVIDDYDAILDKLADLLDQLKLRRDRRKKGLPNPPLMIVADEWASLRAYAAKRKNDVCDEFVLLMGCEARKLNMVTLLCSQSGNVKAMGLEGQGDFLENWCLVRLGKIAKKYCKNLPDRLVADAVAKSAYPCLINDELSYHPTHGSYAVFEEGNTPQNIKPYRKHQAVKNQGTVTPKTISNSPKSESEIIRNYLDRLYHLPDYNPPKDTRNQGENQGEKFSIQGESENGGENAETQTEREFSPCGESENEGETTPEPGNLESSIESENVFTLDEAGKVLGLRKEAKTKPEIIVMVWGVKPGKSRKYESAKAKFEAIQAYWESLNLWV